MSALEAFKQWKKSDAFHSIDHEVDCIHRNSALPLYLSACDCAEKAIFYTGYNAGIAVNRLTVKLPTRNEIKAAYCESDSTDLLYVAMNLVRQRIEAAE